MKTLLAVLLLSGMALAQSISNGSSSGASTNPTTGTIPVKSGASTFGDTPITVSPATTSGAVAVLPAAAVVPFTSQLAIGDTTSHISNYKDASGNIRFFVGPDGSANCLTALGATCNFLASGGNAAPTATPGTGAIGFNVGTENVPKLHWGNGGVDYGPIATMDISNGFFEKDEFCGGSTSTNASGVSGDLGWSSIPSGASTISSLDGIANHRCIEELTTGATNTNNIALQLVGGGSGHPVIGLDTANWKWQSVLQLKQTVTETVNFGFQDTANNGQNGYYFAYDPAVNSHWQIVTISGGSGNTQTTSITPDSTTFHKYEIIGAAGTITFLIDGVVVGSPSTTHLTAIALRPYFFIQTNAGVAASMDLDAWSLRADPVR